MYMRATAKPEPGSGFQNYIVKTSKTIAGESRRAEAFMGFGDGYTVIGKIGIIADGFGG